MVKIGMGFQSSTFDVVQHSQFCDCMLPLIDKIHGFSSVLSLCTVLLCCLPGQ
jgi:hypothetical protein